MRDSRARTKDDLVQAFWMLYRTQPLPAITVKSVASKAGYYRTTFYKYFNSIDDILHYVQKQRMPTNQTQDPSLNSSRLTDAIVDAYINDAEYLTALVGPGVDAAFYEEHLNELRAYAREMIFKKNSLEETEFDLVFECFYAGVNFALRRWYVNYHEQISVTEIKELLGGIYQQGFEKMLCSKTVHRRQADGCRP